MAYQSFEDLQVWRRGKELAVKVYRVLEHCKDFGLRDQMQRAAISIPSNIAEGSERTPKEFARFLSFAIGSSSELRTQTYIASELKIIEPSVADSIIDETKQLNRMMRSLSKSQQPRVSEDQAPCTTNDKNLHHKILNRSPATSSIGLKSRASV